ncbi:MAG: class I SAM-dependent methyltransferase [Bacteroidaceae bacterium]|nr:class I SAM-dependent methyltransferase [Bacteroidaceae bacterium]
MKTDKDPMGAAIRDYYLKGKASRLRVFSPDFDEDEMPVPTLFRNFKEMSPLEQKALELAKGKILDVGAGSGCHSLSLQEMGKNVVAIDISPLSVQTMKDRGVKVVKEINFFQIEGEFFDTILMLMNGAGIIGKIDKLPVFFSHIKSLLAPDGILLLDSSDLRYLYEEEDGSFMIDLNDNYYGEMEFYMQYKDIKGDQFPWLYIDFNTLQMYAEENGFKAELILVGDHYDYLAKIYR